MVLWKDEQYWETFNQTQEKKKSGHTQTNKIRNEIEITTKTTEIQRIIRNYHEQLYINTFYNVEEKKFLEEKNIQEYLPRLHFDEIEGIVEFFPFSKSSASYRRQITNKLCQNCVCVVIRDKDQIQIGQIKEHKWLTDKNPVHWSQPKTGGSGYIFCLDLPLSTSLL